MDRLIRHSFFLLFIVSLGATAIAQSTAFSYQGHLETGGVAANGNHDFQFQLYSELSGGSPIGIGSGISNVPVVNGSFSVLVNFQNQFPGANRFLEIRVRPSGQGNFTILSPRQFIASSPYSVKSLNADNAAQLGGVAANQFVVTTDSRLADARNPLPGSNSYIQNRVTQQAATHFNVSGTGTLGGSLSVGDAASFQKSVTVGTTLSVSEGVGVGGTLSVGGGLTVSSFASATGSINTGSQFNIGGAFALGRSRLDLFNTSPSPRGFTFEVLNSPEFLVVKNDQGSTLMTVASDGKVGIGDNLPTQATLEVGGAVQVSGNLVLGQLGGSVGEHLCKGVGDTVKACSAAGAKVESENSFASSRLKELETTVVRQKKEIEKQRNELIELRRIVCSVTRAVQACATND